MRPPRNISRVDHNNFHGWFVNVRRRGTRHTQYFSDRAFGGRGGALREAAAWRERLLEKLPASKILTAPSSRNRSGTAGVYVILGGRRGREVVGYGATWNTVTGRRIRKSFSVGRYGKRKARQMAEAAREQGVKALEGKGAKRRLPARGRVSGGRRPRR